MSVVEGMCRQGARGALAGKGCAVDCVCSVVSFLLGEATKRNSYVDVITRLDCKPIELVLEFMFLFLQFACGHA